MSRHPYTYSCDFIRAYAGHKQNGCNLSRSDASKIRQAIALALGMTDEDLAVKLSEHYQAHEAAITSAAVDSIQRACEVHASPAFPGAQF